MPISWLIHASPQRSPCSSRASPWLRVAAGQRVDKGDNREFSRQDDGEPDSSLVWFGHFALGRCFTPTVTAESAVEWTTPFGLQNVI